MERQAAQPGKRTSTKDARRAVMILQRAEAIIKETREGKYMEYRDYLAEAEKLSKRKVWAITAATFLASIPFFLQHDFYGTSTEAWVMAGIPVLGACGVYQIEYGSTLSTILSPYKTFKARGKQNIEDKLYRLFSVEREQKEKDVVLALVPLLKELNYSLKKVHRSISYDQKWGTFSMKTITVETQSLETKPAEYQLSKWDGIYVLATPTAKERKVGPGLIPHVDFTPALIEKENLTVEEAIAVLKHTEDSLKEELEKTKSPESTWATPRDPSNEEYIKEEARLLADANPALEVLNGLIHPSDGKVVYIPGTRFPNFNISQPSTKKKLGKWDAMEQMLAVTVPFGRITALDSLKLLELPHKPKSPA